MLLFSTLLFAQNKEEKTEQKPKERAKEQIIQLKKEGVLLVRLSDRKKIFADLRNRGYHAYVDKAEKELQEEHKEIMSAFAKEYNFCPVYFFYSSQSSFLLKKQWDSIAFFDSLGAKVAQDSLIGKYMLVAEFGVVEADTAIGREVVYSPYSDHRDKDLNVKKHFKKSNIEINALVVKSDELVQLEQPFPFSVRTYEYLVFKRKKSKVVALLNAKLWNFFEKVNS